MKSHKPQNPPELLIHRVELKRGIRKHSLWEKSLLLIHRVELKRGFNRENTFQCSCVANPPCGVETKPAESEKFRRVLVANPPCGVETIFERCLNHGKPPLLIHRVELKRISLETDERW